ncbi:hypothetical protein MycrhN_3084 [Mycolicibacterium rhodesiae NBB3]|uniref:Uncharacterized protein n=1 Tax=Mycolicibacterium rhodesiae (strain NBB3) TaxID=710685 RepID=G8RKC3_MYCRN|nr:hypothetical protein MycrhN_2976 [Mycolicibacterium rhodesiae NBB3]AEV73620.1 hypothetical protein MycrhN_3084 [Mycolicibacterium rhodesiae NBB3]
MVLPDAPSFPLLDSSHRYAHLLGVRQCPDVPVTSPSLPECGRYRAAGKVASSRVVYESDLISGTGVS